MFERFIERENSRILPLSGNIYIVDIKDGIKKNDSSEIETIIDDYGDIFVKIDWIDGFRFYNLATLISFTYKPVKLKLKYWNALSVMFADRNNSNLHPSNLVWKFPIGLGSKDHADFAFIPMYSRYMINRKGEIFDTIFKRMVTGHYNKGYHSFSLIPDIGPRTCLKRHRGICLAFTDYSEKVDSLQVNHINGIPGDDRLENLEWVTCSENKIHALNNGLLTINKPVLVLNLRTEEEKEYNSLGYVSEAFNLNKRTLSKYLSTNDGGLVLGDYVFSYKNPDHRNKNNHSKQKILVRDVRTGIVSEYESIVDCSEKLCISKHIVQWRINTPTLNLQPDYLQFKRKTDNTPWYIPKDFEKEIQEKNWIKEILIRNLDTGEILELGSQRLASKLLNISESTIIQQLSKSNRAIFKHNKHGYLYQLKRKSDISSWEHVKNPKEEYESYSNLKSVLVKNVLTGEVKKYDSASSCAKELNLLPTTLNWRLKSKGMKLYPDGYLFKYANDASEFMTINSTVLSVLTNAPNSSNVI